MDSRSENRKLWLLLGLLAAIFLYVSQEL